MKLFVHDYLHVSEDEYTPKQDADVFAYLLKCEKELIGTWHKVFLCRVFCHVSAKTNPSLAVSYTKSDRNG